MSSQDKVFVETILNKQVITSIKSDIIPLLSRDERIGGYFAVPMLVFTMTEYLGVLLKGKYKGKDEAIEAVNFIRKYFGDINERYREIGGLLYDMFRHGTVHERQPKIYIYSDNNPIGWEIIKNERYSEHLNLDKGRYLVVVLDVLCDDLLKAIELYLKDLLKHIGLRAKFITAYNQMKAAKSIKEVKNKRKYIKDDFEIIRNEIKKIF